MRMEFVTLFPEAIEVAFGSSILRRAQEAGRVETGVVNPRDFTHDTHRTVDDSPYGGGPGMVMKPEPIDAALCSLKLPPGAMIVMPDPTGPRFEQAHAQLLAKAERVVFLCGHYEGIDLRVCEKWVTHSFSLGDFVLTGGELPALIMADAIIRLLPGALGNTMSTQIDSFSDGLLSAPQFTRPAVWEGREVPTELQCGDHTAANRWKRRQSLRITRQNRPDLFIRAKLNSSDLELMQD